MTTEMEVIWTQSLPPDNLAQRAKIITLKQTLIMEKILSFDIYSDRYTFITVPFI